jgi:sugar phosphate isomerase/epimerase
LANADVPRNPADITPDRLARWSGLGVRGLITHFATAPDEVAALHAPTLSRLLVDHDVAIFQYAGVNANLVHPDRDLPGEVVPRIRAACVAAQRLGAQMLICGCGSYDERNFYGPHPGNHTEPARRRLIDALRLIAPIVADHGLVLALECHVLTTLDTPERIREILDEVDSPAVGANFDPVNLLGSVAAVHDNAVEVRRIRSVIGDRCTASAHIKDVRITTELVVHIAEAPPGHGCLDYAAYFEAVSTLPAGSPLIVEHLEVDQVDEALDFVRRTAAENGVTV